MVSGQTLGQEEVNLREWSLFHRGLLAAGPSQWPRRMQAANYDDDMYIDLASDCMVVRQCNNGHKVVPHLESSEERRVEHICVIPHSLKAELLYSCSINGQMRSCALLTEKASDTVI